MRAAAASPCSISSTSARSSRASSSDGLAGLALGVEVEERLVGIRQHLRPAALVEQLDPVGEVEVAACETLVQHAHHEALERPRAGHLVVDERRLRQLGHELRQRPVDGRQQLEQLREARNRVVAGQELGEDVAAAHGAREDDAALGRGARQLRQRGRRPHDLELRVLDEPLDLARHGHREGELAVAAVRAEQAEEEEQRLLDRHLVRLLVDEVEPLGRAVEDRAEIGARPTGTSRFVWPIEAASPGAASA